MRLFLVVTAASLSLPASMLIMSHLRKSDGSRTTRTVLVTVVSFVEMVVGIFIAIFAVIVMVGDVLNPTGQGIAFGISLFFFIPAALLTASGVFLYKPEPKGALILHLVTLLPLLGLTYLQGEAYQMYGDAGNLRSLVILFVFLGIPLLGCLASISLMRSRAK